ncbi:MAG: sugar ABC transporter substrate-binding protein [Clostridiales bacterium]|nr:sugar ABC transporter substrate-binding protein [Clostridiales bacterium]
MKKYSKVLAVVLALALAISLAACTSAPAPAPAPEPAPAPAPAPEPAAPAELGSVTAEGFEIPFPAEDYRVVMTIFNGQNPVARAIESGFEGAVHAVNAASDAGQIDLWLMDNELDPIQMNANADMAIAAGDVDFYVLYTNDVASNPQIMDKLVPADIPVYTIGTAAIASDGTAAPHYFVGADNFESAKMAGAAVAQAAKDKGWDEDDIVYVSMGFLEAGGVFITRTEAALEGVQSVFPNISEENGNYVETSSEGSAETAHQRMADNLTRFPGKKVIVWTHSDDVTGSCLAAVRSANRSEDALLVSNGLTIDMIGMLREPDGIVIGSVDLSFGLWGYEMMGQIIEYLNNGTPIPMENNAPYKLVTPQNVDQYYPQ